MNHSPTTTHQDKDDNHVSTVRSMLIEQIRAVRQAATGEDIKMEVEKSRAISSLANSVTELARVEVDYAKASNGNGTVSFLEAGEVPATTATPTGLVHRIR